MATEGGDPTEQRVTPLELFFDLVFVFALTQVTGFLADHLTWVGMIQGSALLAVLWWAWGGYAWLTNAVPAEEVIPARLVILTAMASMLVASLAVPDAFGEYGVLFGLSYFVVRLLQVLLYALATRGTPGHPPALEGLPARPGAADRGRVSRWLRTGRALGLGSRHRLRRGPPRRCLGLPRTCGALRGAPRPRDHHSLGRVDRGGWCRGLGAGYRRGDSPRHRARGRAGRRSVVGVLRPRHACRRAEAFKGKRRRAGETGARLLQLPAPADGGRDNLRCSGRQADPGPRR